MATIMICNRTTGNKSSRIPLEGVNLDSAVSDFRKRASKVIGVPIEEIDLIYCGRRMKDDEPLYSYGIKAGVTVHALKKVVEEKHSQQPEPMDRAAVDQVVTALQTALLNPAYRNTVETMISNPETLENLIATTPGLDQDPIAISMLQDPELLALLADPNHIHSVIEAHPSLGQAAMTVAAAVNEEGAKSQSRTGSGATRSTYSLDQMSDDEDEAGPSQRIPPGQPITIDQLAAALAAGGAGGGAAGGRGAATPAPPTHAQPRVPTEEAITDQSSMITADFLRHAMLQAGGQQSAPSGDTQPQPEAVTEAQLQQMRDMGITDESLARRALAAADGDIHAAIELIFGDGSF